MKQKDKFYSQSCGCCQACEDLTVTLCLLELPIHPLFCFSEFQKGCGDRSHKQTRCVLTVSQRRAGLQKKCLCIFQSVIGDFQSNTIFCLLGMILERERFLNKGKAVMEITSFCFLTQNAQNLRVGK